MKFNIDPRSGIYSINLLGELLRNEFFDQKEGYGCYQSFDFAEGVKRLPDEIETVDNEGRLYSWQDMDNEVWICCEKEIDGTLVKMKYYWDGDGTLIFSTNEWTLTNTDCKKDYGWEFVEKN